MSCLDSNYDCQFANKYQEAANYLSVRLNSWCPIHFNEIEPKKHFN